MKLAIVDDEKKMTDLLYKYSRKFEKENGEPMQISTYHNPDEFLKQYSSDFDLVLMDIEMPGLNGIETAKELRRMDGRVVLMFITNMAQYAISGYEVEAIDFVIKPVAYPDFALKIHKAMRYVKRNKDHKVALNTQEGTVYLHLSDIYYIEVRKHYLLYHTIDGEHSVRGVLKETEETLKEYHFARSSHCYLVNLKYVESINGNVVKVAGDELQISRNKKSQFLVEFTRYVGGMY